MTSKNPIILDCDPGEDDALAILLVLAKNLNMSALVCGFGNASAQKTFRNGAGLLTLAGRTNIPLFKGAEKPYQQHPLERVIVSAGDFVGENGLCGVTLPQPPDDFIVRENKTEDERIEDLANHLRSMGPLTYIVTGPCTTLAHVLDRLGDEADKFIRQIIIMGGALDAFGNTGPINPETGKSYAEFNFYCDPHAVARVFKSSLPVTLVPWDLTEKIVMTYEELLSWQSKNKEGSFVINLMRNFLESYGKANDRSFEFNDCITITAFEGEGDFREECVKIILQGEQTGRLVHDNNHGRKLQFFNIKPENILPTRNQILNTLGIKINTSKEK